MKIHAFGKTLAHCALAVGCLATLPAALAETYTFQQGANGYSGATSTYTEYQPSEAQSYNYGSKGSLIFYSPLGDGAPKKVGFMRFDLSSIASPVSVESVSLNIWMAGNGERNGPGYSQTFQIFPILREGLDFGNSNGVAEDGAVSFNAAAYDTVSPIGWGSSLTGNYGPVAGEDYSTTSMGSYVMSDVNAVESNFTFSLSASVVQSWINNPASNLGFVFVLDQSIYDQAIVYTGNESQIYRPTLSIDATAVPEPGVAAFLGVGALALTVRARLRRRVNG